MTEAEKHTYTMTPDEFKQFKSACNPGKIVLINAPLPLSAEERAAIFWNRMSEKYRFHVDTVEPDLDGHPGQFKAVPLPEPTEHDNATVH